jgi:hypothetical protein
VEISGSKKMEDSVYLVKDILQLILCQGRTLDVFNSAKFLSHPVTVFLADGGHLLAGELVPHTGIIAQIGLSADDQAGNTGAVMVDFREPLFADVLE